MTFGTVTTVLVPLEERVTTNRRKRSKSTKRKLLTVSGAGVWHSRLHFSLPTWIAVGLAFTLAALLISPEFAAAITLALWELLRRSSPAT